MRAWVFISSIFWLACSNEPTPTPVTKTTSDTATKSITTTTLTDTTTEELKDTTDGTPAVQETRKPSGIYQFVLPYDDNIKILHTIAFYPTTFRLQEEYLNKKDSMDITEGTWAPSEGFIWLYKDQIVRGRYTWNGNTLQYYSPRWKKNFPMKKLTPAVGNPVWQEKKKAGNVLYAVGNEPFWSIDINQDSISLSMPDWTEPLQAKRTNTNQSKDSTVYLSAEDSLRVVVYPYFCNDGMSDFIYTNKVKVYYKGQAYKGCGQAF